MQRLTVNSSHIAAAGYDPKEHILEVEFAAGQVYHYYDVPQDVYDGLVAASSPGTYFYAYVSKQYRYKEITNDTGRPQTLAFATGNERKFLYCKEACAVEDIEVDQLELDVDEIQSGQPEKVAIAKAREAYRLSRRPVLANDLFWAIPALRGFPGAYAKEVDDWFDPEDFLKLMQDKKDRSIVCTETLVYFDGKIEKVFSKQYWGQLVLEPRGSRKSLMQLVQLDGRSETISEIEERGEQPYTAQPTIWQEFAKWYKLQKRMKRV